MDKNQLIDLTPIFDDYKLHMTSLKSQYGVKPKTDKVKNIVVFKWNILAIGILKAGVRIQFWPK